MIGCVKSYWTNDNNHQFLGGIWQQMGGRLYIWSNSEAFNQGTTWWWYKHQHSIKYHHMCWLGPMFLVHSPGFLPRQSLRTLALAVSAALGEVGSGRWRTRMTSVRWQFFSMGATEKWVNHNDLTKKKDKHIVELVDWLYIAKLVDN